MTQRLKLHLMPWLQCLSAINHNIHFHPGARCIPLLSPFDFALRQIEFLTRLFATGLGMSQQDEMQSIILFEHNMPLHRDRLSLKYLAGSGDARASSSTIPRIFPFIPGKCPDSKVSNSSNGKPSSPTQP
jgi:hypothetical protein